MIIHKIRQTHFWKQTTTLKPSCPKLFQLYTKFVKHTFESKPQLYYSPFKWLIIIHKIRQTHFWKQTTTDMRYIPPLPVLYTKFVKHTFESKPQQAHLERVSKQDYTQNSSNTLLKANHNSSHCVVCYAGLYTKFVKHTFESKPQHFEDLIHQETYYTQNSSNTLLKANHNMQKFFDTIK